MDRNDHILNTEVAAPTSVRSTESTVLIVIFGIVASLILVSGVVVYTLSDRIIQKFAIQETLAEEKEAAMESVKERALGEGRQKLSRAEKMQYVSIVNLESSGEVDDVAASEGVESPFLCVVSKKFAGVGTDVTWQLLFTQSLERDYAVSWQGSDDLVGNAAAVTKNFSTTGVKTATAAVRDKNDPETVVSITCPEVRVQAADSW